MLSRTLAVVLIAATTIFCQSTFAQSADEVKAAIAAHFKVVKPEIARYKELATYGETTSGTAPSKELVAKESELLKQAIAAGLIQKGDEQALYLGHNVLVHDPVAADSYLTALQALPVSMRGVGNMLLAATIVAGEEGERRAVAGLESPEKERREFWSKALASYALYRSSAPAIQSRFAAEKDVGVKANLLTALCMIGDPASTLFVKEQMQKATDDGVQTAAIFAFAELAGYDGIADVEALTTVGPEAKEEKTRTLEWLKTETKPQMRHGREVTSDEEFVGRFGDLYACPAIKWMHDEKLLEEDAVKNPPTLNAAKKQKLFELLTDARGFGLEAVKGAIFKSLTKADEAALLRVRAACMISPNGLTVARLKTLGIMIRHVRQDAPDALPAGK